jgi:hypothetical protein
MTKALGPHNYWTTTKGSAHPHNVASAVYASAGTGTPAISPDLSCAQMMEVMPFGLI